MTATLPRKRRAGRPKARDSLSPAAVESITRSALDAHGLTGVEAPTRWGVKTGIVLLARQGLDLHEIADRFGVTYNICQVHCSQYRKTHKISLDAWKAEIATNVALRRTGRTSTTLEPLKAPRDEPAVPPLDEEMMQFVEDLGAIAVMRELEAQGKPMERAQVDALSESAYCRILQDAEVREANKRFYGYKGD